jgi:type IV fimbrial biogenesis protein FimT
MGLIKCLTVARLKRPNKGVTLVELMVVLAIIAIFAGMAFPAMQAFLLGNRLTATTNELLLAINLTRSEAVKRGARVDMVPADGASWASGWTVFIDLDNDLVPDAGEEIILTHGAVDGSFTLDSNLPQHITYQANGRTRTHGSANAWVAGTITLQSGDHERRIIINNAGRARVCNPKASSNTCG